jgi:hypothetical protein
MREAASILRTVIMLSVPRDNKASVGCSAPLQKSSTGAVSVPHIESWGSWKPMNFRFLARVNASGRCAALRQRAF